MRSRGSPRLPRSRMTSSTASALCITHTCPGRGSQHLPPFAVWAALPPADYYGGSVAVGLAPRRRSCIPTASDVRARRRRLVRRLAGAPCAPPTGRKVPAASTPPPYPGGPAVDVVLGG